MTENTRDVVDGKKIIARQVATTKSHFGSTDELVEVKSVELVMFDDETTAFMCNHKNAPNCAYTGDAVVNITAHQRAHSDRIVAKRATAALAQLQEKVTADQVKRSAAAKKAVTAREAKKAAAKVDPHTGRRADDDLEMGIIAALDTLDLVAATLEKSMHDLEAAAANLKRDIETLKRRKGTIPPEIVEKAKKYDALKGILG